MIIEIDIRIRKTPIRPLKILLIKGSSLDFNLNQPEKISYINSINSRINSQKRT